jgi:hypothetical protein
MSDLVGSIGNGNDTDTVTVCTGQDSFVFEQTTPGNIGALTVTGFEPNKDSFTFSTQLTTSVSYHNNAQGNAVVTVDNAGDTITLVGELVGRAGLALADAFDLGCVEGTELTSALLLRANLLGARPLVLAWLSSLLRSRLLHVKSPRPRDYTRLSILSDAATFG